MQVTSEAYKSAIKANTRTLEVRGRIQTPEGTIYDLSSSDIVSGSLSVKYSIFDAGIEIGNAFAADCSVSIYNDEGAWNNRLLTGAALWLWSGVVLPDDTTEEVLLGTFVIEKPGRPNRIITIEAADRMVLFDTPFSDVALSFPANLQTILEAVCEHCAVPLQVDSWTGALNMDYLVSARPTDDLSCRDVVGLIASLSAANVRMTRAGYLERVSLDPLTSVDLTLGASDRFTFEQTSDEIAITGIAYTSSSGAQFLAGTDTYALSLSANAFLQSGENEMIASIWTNISGFSYTAFSCDYPGDPAIEVGDTVKHITRLGTEILSVVGVHTYAVGQTSTLSVPFVEATGKSYLSGNTKRLTSIAAKMDQVKNELTQYSLKSSQISDLITAGLGLYKFDVPQPDGSVVVIYGNKSTLEESNIQWKMTADIFAVSHDYGATWSAGITADGEMLATILTAIGINAEWIRVGRLSSQYIDMDGSGNNLVVNSEFDGDIPVDVSSSYSLGWVPWNGGNPNNNGLRNELELSISGWLAGYDGYEEHGTWKSDGSSCAFVGGWMWQHLSVPNASYQPNEFISYHMTVAQEQVYTLSFYGSTGTLLGGPFMDPDNNFGINITTYRTDAYSVTTKNIFYEPLVADDPAYRVRSQVMPVAAPFTLKIASYNESTGLYTDVDTTFSDFVPVRYSVTFTIPYAHSRLVIYLRDQRTSATAMALVSRIQLEPGYAATAYRSSSDLAGSRIVNLATPINAMDAANKAYVDSDWTPVKEAWTYASATTITVPAGAVDRYQKFDKLKYTQSGVVKYGRVLAVTNTTLTLIPSSTYSVTNSAISDISLSRKATPFGFPAAVNWRQSFSGIQASNVYVQSSSYYIINDNNTLSLSIFFTATGNYLGNQQALFTLPTGFRPSGQRIDPMSYQRAQQTVRYLCDFVIEATGVARVSYPVSETIVEHLFSNITLLL